MRKSLLFVLFIFLMFSPTAAGPKQSTFSIYLVEGEFDQRLLRYNPGELADVKLSSMPIISETDIISYDFSKHAMRLKPEAIKRLPRPSASGIPFVVVTNGERIYLGAFYSSFSSITCAVPVIVVDQGTTKPDQGEDVLVIERAYPPYKGVGVDRRGDRRIRDALRELKKL